MKYKALLFSLFATANLFAQHPAIHFEIETDQPCQTMDYFGASACGEFYKQIIKGNAE